jgi:hypothetical protein
VLESAIHEIGDLIDELERLRKKLKTDGDRIRRDVEAYAELSKRVMQLTSIISDSVKKLPLWAPIDNHTSVRQTWWASLPAGP